MRKITVSIPVPQPTQSRLYRKVSGVPSNVKQKASQVHPVESVKSRFARDVDKKIQGSEFNEVNRCFVELMKFDYSDSSPECLAVAQEYLDAVAAYGMFLGRTGDFKTMRKGMAFLNELSEKNAARATPEEQALTDFLLASGAMNEMNNEAMAKAFLRR